METISTQQILGFDAREMWHDFDESFFWPPDRKESMLIRQDIVKPLSTQDTVWESVFDIIALRDNGEFKLYEDSRLKPPNWTGTLGLWQNLQGLQDCLTAGWGDDWEPCWLIAITTLPHTFSAEEQAYWRNQRVSPVPATLDENWQFLGFDVSDGYLLSGLMGCGHPASDKALIPILNKFHLFTDLAQALQYKEDMNVGNIQHAPFFVYGLYLIKDSATGKSWKGSNFLRLLEDNS